MKISEMEVGKNIMGTLVLAEASVRKTNSRPPRPFLQATLTDGTEQITGMLWQWNPEANAPETGLVYDIAAQVSEYQGKKQLNLSLLRVSANQDTSEFEAVYECDADDLYQRALATITQMESEGLRELCRYVYIRYEQQIKRSTSATGVHHVGAGGNIAHTMDVAYIARWLAKHFALMGVVVSEELVTAGALMHDIGKPDTYMISGPVVDYTEAGQLFDHILLGIEIINEANVQTGFKYNEHAELLKHIVASHHGQKEYGSPVTPKFLEAYLVNMADGISATTDTLWQANLKAQRDNKQMTDRIWTLGNVSHFLQQTIAEKLSLSYSES